MKKAAISVLAGLLAVGVTKADILAGWNEFAPNDNAVNSYVDDSSPDVSVSGISGIIGGNVNAAFTSVGGGERSGSAYDQGFDTFGNLAGTGSAAAADSGVRLLHDYDGTGDKNRLDFMITNNTGNDVAVDGIHFDIKTVFKGGAAVIDYGTAAVSHFSAVSDLNDAFANRNLGSTTLSNFAWQQLDVSAAAMTDLIIADGESAAFRIEVNWSDAAATGNPTWNVDNVAISGTVIPEPATLSLIAAFGGTVLFIRRRFCI